MNSNLDLIFWVMLTGDLIMGAILFYILTTHEVTKKKGKKHVPKSSKN